MWKCCLARVLARSVLGRIKREMSLGARRVNFESPMTNVSELGRGGRHGQTTA